MGIAVIALYREDEFAVIITIILKIIQIKRSMRRHCRRGILKINNEGLILRVEK